MTSSVLQVSYTQIGLGFKVAIPAEVASNETLRLGINIVVLRCSLLTLTIDI